jgi:protein-disulfide isomerase
VLGDPKAPVTVTEYLDLQCPICAATSKSTLPALVRDYVRTGKVKLAVRTLHFIGPDSTRAARVAAAAQQQGRLWPFIEAFYARQGTENTGYVTDAFLRGVATAAGVDASSALSGANGAFATAQLKAADSGANRLAITGTPTLTVTPKGGKETVLSASPLDPAAVSAELNGLGA